MDSRESGISYFLRITSAQSSLVIKADDGEFSREGNQYIQDDCPYQGHSLRRWDRWLHSFNRVDSYWKIYLAHDIETNQVYDVRVATFDQGDMKSLNRLKQEIFQWVEIQRGCWLCRNTCQSMEILSATTIPRFTMKKIWLEVSSSRSIVMVVSSRMS